MPARPLRAPGTRSHVVLHCLLRIEDSFIWRSVPVPIDPFATDIRMPAYTGLEILAGLREAGLHMPVVRRYARACAASSARIERRQGETMKYPIVVGTNLTHASDEALIQAEARASRDEMPLTVVHTLSQRLWGSTNDAGDVEHLRALIEQQVTALTGRPRSEYDVVVERGSTHSVLARLAASQHALLVVGSAEHHGLGHALLKDVSERVVERAWGPVLVARPRTDSARILVAIDWPFHKSPSLDIAIDEARCSHAELIVLHCVNASFLGTIATYIVNGNYYAEHPLSLRWPLGEARRALRAELQLRHVDPPLYVVEGEASSLISQFAAQTHAGLVIVGTPHHPGPTPHVTTAVLRHAPCSVLVVDDSSVPPPLDPALQAKSN